MASDERRSRKQEGGDMPSVEPDTPARDPNLEEQTVQSEEPGPGASKMENIRRMRKQVEEQEKRMKPQQPETEEQEE